MMTLLKRFESKYIPEPNSGCWIWDARINAGGYGVFFENGKDKPAHRVSYTLFKGPIPDGLEIDHLCRVRCCVNPDHLDAVTRLVNIRRGLPYRKKVTHCPQGHPYSGDNLYVHPKDGRRMCRACNRIRKYNAYHPTIRRK